MLIARFSSEKTEEKELAASKFAFKEKSRVCFFYIVNHNFIHRDFINDF